MPLDGARITHLVLNADAARRVRTRTRWAWPCKTSGPGWARHPLWPRQRSRISWPVSANRSAGSWCRSNRGNAPGFRCPCHNPHNEIRRLACPENNHPAGSTQAGSQGSTCGKRHHGQSATVRALCLRRRELRLATRTIGAAGFIRRRRHRAQFLQITARLAQLILNDRPQ